MIIQSGDFVVIVPRKGHLRRKPASGGFGKVRPHMMHIKKRSNYINKDVARYKYNTKKEIRDVERMNVLVLASMLSVKNHPYADSIEKYFTYDDETKTLAWYGNGDNLLRNAEYCFINHSEYSYYYMHQGDDFTIAIHPPGMGEYGETFITFKNKHDYEEAKRKYSLVFDGESGLFDTCNSMSIFKEDNDIKDKKTAVKEFYSGML